MNKKMNKNGFSLVELAIGLAVVTILILAVSMSSGIQDNARVQSAANSVQSLRSAAENYLVSGKVSYTGISLDALKASKFLPDNFNATGTNPWGGDFILATNNDATRYDISLSGLKQQDADKLTAYFSGNASRTVFDASAGTWTVTF